MRACGTLTLTLWQWNNERDTFILQSACGHPMSPLKDKIRMDEDVGGLDQEVVCVPIVKPLKIKGLLLVCTDEVDNVYLRVGTFKILRVVKEDFQIALRNRCLNSRMGGQIRGDFDHSLNTTIVTSASHNRSITHDSWNGQ